MPAYRHILIIGGTGMLEQASLALATQSKHTTFAARHADAFIAHHAISNAGAVTADYIQTQHFMNAIKTECAAYGAVDLALIWIHDIGNESLKALLAVLAESPCRIVHVLGSSNASAHAQTNVIAGLIKQSKNLTYRSVVLGSKPDGRGGRRWLTHEEISNGTLYAIAYDTNNVIGERPVFH